MISSITSTFSSEQMLSSKQKSFVWRTAGMSYIATSDDGKEDHRMVVEDFVKRGKELRAKLQQTYKKLVDSNELRGGLHGTDVTYAVLPYIPIGTSFSGAVAILRNAGFVVGPHPDSNPPPNPNRPKDWYAVVAQITPFAQKFPSRTDLYVSLLPKSPGDYTIVSRIDAQFFISLP